MSRDQTKSNTDPPSMTCSECGRPLERANKWQCLNCDRAADSGYVASYREKWKQEPLFGFVRYDSAFMLIVLCLYLPLSPMLFASSNFIESLFGFITMPAMPFACCLGGRFGGEIYFLLGLIVLFFVIHLAAAVARQHKLWLVMICAVSFTYGCVLLLILIRMLHT